MSLTQTCIPPDCLLFLYVLCIKALLLYPLITSPFRSCSCPPSLYLPQGQSDQSVAFLAAADVAASQPLIFCYGPKSTDDLLLNYGFVPHGNIFDSIVLAADGRELISLLFKHMAGEGGTIDTQEAGRVVETTLLPAIEAVGEAVLVAKRQWEMSIGMELDIAVYEVQEGKPYRVWFGGHVDPRMIASLAAMWLMLVSQDAGEDGQGREDVSGAFIHRINFLRLRAAVHKCRFCSRFCQQIVGLMSADGIASICSPDILSLSLSTSFLSPNLLLSQ